MKRGEITLTEVGYLLLALMVIGAILMSVSRGCDLIQSNKEQAQAQGTLTQLVNFLDSMKENEQSSFIIYSPKKYFLTSFADNDTFYSCSTNCLCICEEESCLEDNSYCRDIKKPLSEKFISPISIGSILIVNNKENYQFIAAIQDVFENEVTLSENCSGNFTILVGNFLIRESVKAAFDKAQENASKMGLKLIVSSAHRTLRDQQEIRKSPTYGSGACNPVGDGMNCPHVTGCAIDVCFGYLCEKTKRNLPADLVNADTLMLKQIMEQAGFKGIKGEYWHFEYGLSRKGVIIPDTIPSYAKPKV